MTRILALDTSTTACSVALNCYGQIEEDFALAPQDHTKRLLPMVDKLLAAHQLRLNDLDAIAYTHGPGSFTGLRICVGIVQGLAFGADLPVVSASTLETMAASAQRLLALEADTYLVPALDARMNEVYWGLYRTGTGVRAESRMADSVSAPRDLLAALQGEQVNGSLHILGSACPLLDAQQLAVLGASTHEDVYPHAYDLARIAEVLVEAGECRSALNASPIYIRNEVSWAKRKRIRS